MDWGQGNTEERTERSVCFGGKSVQLRLDSLKGVLAGLSKQKADTITNVFLRRVFKDGNAPTVDAVLLPFASMCLAGTVHPDAMAILLAGRLALIPKVDGAHADADWWSGGAVGLSPAGHRRRDHALDQHRGVLEGGLGGGQADVAAPAGCRRSSWRFASPTAPAS